MSEPIAQKPVKPGYDPQISGAFPFESKFMDVLGSKMHFIDEGEGDPILFLHGNPTSSYLWRNIIPFLRPQGRVIAVDLIGLGKSDKPDIDYRFQDHSRYLEKFIELLGLKNITFVIHDWGSVLGLHYASRYEENVRGVAFMEAFVPPNVPFASYNSMGRIAPLFQKMRDPEVGPDMILEQNFFIERILPGSVIRNLSEAEHNYYRAPFVDVKSRKPTYVFPNEVPIAGEPADTHKVIVDYSKWMLETNIAFLHIYASPGSFNPPAVAEWLASHIKNIETSFVGGGLHYIQEDQPEAIGRAIADWHRRLFNKYGMD